MQTDKQPNKLKFTWMIVPAGLLLFVIVMAGLLNRDYTHIRSIGYIAWWARLESFHIIAHLTIFSLLGLMIGAPLPRKHLWVIWVVVVLGTLLIESMQIISRGLGLWPNVINAALFDFGVNLIGGGIAWTILHWVKHESKSSA